MKTRDQGSVIQVHLHGRLRNFANETACMEVAKKASNIPQIKVLRSVLTPYL